MAKEIKYGEIYGNIPQVSVAPTNYGELVNPQQVVNSTSAPQTSQVNLYGATGGTGTGAVTGASTPSTTYAANGFGIDVNTATTPDYLKYAYNLGIQNAEATRQQTVQGARARYNQDINPYGVMANQQAKAGMTGGGYSQYLQGVAYQSMIDTQNQARANEAATKQGLYSDYLKGMVEYNEKKAEQNKQTDIAKADLLNNIGTYNSLEAVNSALNALGIADDTERAKYTTAWQTAQDQKTNNAIAGITANIGNGYYPTEESLIADLNANGITGEAQNTYITQWQTKNKQTSSKNEVAFGEQIEGITNPSEIQKLGEANGVSQDVIDLATYKTSPDNIKTAEEWDSFFKNAKYEELNDSEKEKAMEYYTTWYAAENNAIDGEMVDTARIFDSSTLTSDMKTKMKEIENNPYLSDQFKEDARRSYTNKYGSEIAKQINGEKLHHNIQITNKVIDMDSSSVLTDFGKFNDAGTGKGKQDTYLTNILKDAQNGKIEEGKIILPNYGKNEGKTDAFMYIGNGQFVQVNLTGTVLGHDAYYIPQGYGMRNGKITTISKEETQWPTR